jgi:Tfp pilus assembly protein FimV
MSDAVKADAHGQSAEREPYKVQARDTLERVIKKTFPTTPFSNEILREAFMKANPQVFANGKSSRLRAGQSLNLPDAAMLRLIILGEVAAKPAAAHPAGAVHGATDAGHEAPKATAAPATAAVEPAALIAVPRQAVVVASSAGQVPEVSAEEKKKWIRFP